MSQALLNLPKIFCTYTGDEAICKRFTKAQLRRHVPTGFRGVSSPSALRLRSTQYRQFCRDQGGRVAVVIASQALNRYSCVPVLPEAFVVKQRKRLQRRCITEMPDEGGQSSAESLSSSDGTDCGAEDSVESTSKQTFFQTQRYYEVKHGLLAVHLTNIEDFPVRRRCSIPLIHDYRSYGDASVDLKLPRRRMLVEFTCNVCEVRTQRLINPEAYRRGTVFVQCAGCEAYHQLVDNLNLIEEFDFRKENGSSAE